MQGHRRGQGGVAGGTGHARQTRTRVGIITRTSWKPGKPRLYANSPTVESAQTEPHPRLPEILARHWQAHYRRPYAAYSLAAHARLRAWLAQRGQAPLLLDSGCGTGASTLQLAAARPDASVVGIDQSRERLVRGGLAGADFAALTDNAALLRAPLEDIWRLLAADGVGVERHLLWYPNPWPKAAQLRLRWHGHPVFPVLLRLGGEIELRSNWPVYVAEFAQALHFFGWQTVQDEIGPQSPPVTPFERKYRDSGHRLWRLVGRPRGALMQDESTCAS